jgi:hypothetical protein
LNGSAAGEGLLAPGPPPRCTFAPLLYGFPALPLGLTLSCVLACGPSCFGSDFMLLLLCCGIHTADYVVSAGYRFAQTVALGYQPLDAVGAGHQLDSRGPYSAVIARSISRCCLIARASSVTTLRAASTEKL